MSTTPILVKPDIAWNEALTRCEDRDLWVMPVAGDGTEWAVYHAESYSGRLDKSGRSHVVTVDLTHPAIVRVSCSCEAHGPCQHAAGALKEAGAFPYRREYLCICGHTTDDADEATRHRLMSRCAANGQAGAALLLGAKARREGLTTHG